MLWFLVAALFLVPGASVTEPEVPFSHERFCVAARDIEQQSNAGRGTWLDDHTRHDGMSVDCEARAVELKLYVRLPFRELPGNWQDRMGYAWSNDYCGDAGWAASINHHWSVTLTVSSVADETFSSRADCH